ncbi:replication initiator protein [Sigmofec virus UA08Rod_4686]|uniref:Replication initiator protein n=1 Tax=Sigmofec virus UA08Rod_4686 TaxID=2929406 RepID=A0A976R7G4_9VIRU|nr:replication initiator protein [Sigmofec virus UA08Rod_4686]
MADFSVKCLHPTVILHPYAKSYFIRHGKFCYNGELHVVGHTPSNRIKLFDSFCRYYVKPFFASYKKDASCLSYDFLFDNYHFISDDGEFLPMFLLVPCGKCTLCNSTRLNDLSARCALETYTSKCRPLFVTLTYDNEHIPTDGSVSLDDIQKFLKLLRINLNRFFATPYTDENGKILYKDAKISIRYLYSSEYTPNNGRPHYHLLIWNVPYFPNGLSDYQTKFLESRLDGYPDSVSGSFPKIQSPCLLGSSVGCDLGRIYGYDVLKKIIWCSWKKGFVKSEVCRDSSGRYVAKYLGKGSKVPKGCSPTFVRWSTRRGLGFDAYDKYFKVMLLANPSLTELTFVDPKFGKTTKVCIPKYYKSLLTPSMSVISKPFRFDLESFHSLYSFAKTISRQYSYFNMSELKFLHSNVYKKYELFAPLCGLDLPYDERKYNVFLNNVVKSCYTVRHYDTKLLSRVYSQIRTLYSKLMSFDLDSFHLHDLMNWKSLHQLSVSQSLSNSSKTLGYYYDLAKHSEDHYERIARGYDV